ncbi:MAG: hypothetical protein ACTSSH_10475, partial [Candidatus Heimdallarchaeota archaeon]
MADKKSYSISHKTKVQFILAVLALSIIVAINSKNLTYSSAHSTTAYPSEIFSIWNNTDPTLDGQINFKHTDQTTEWAYAAVFNMYDSSNSIGGKLVIQNSNSDLFVGLDGLDFTVELPPLKDWGATIYFDIDHNGYLTTIDRAIRYLFNSSGSFVEFLQFNPQSDSWVALESGSLSVALAFSGIVVSSSFSDSGFDNVTDHRQYEIKIPFAAISSGPGKSLGVAFEMFDDYSDNTAGITWPFIITDQHNIRTMASVFGDISFAAATSESFDFVVEENLNVKSSALGYNNGSYITSGDLDGDGDLELIASSNRTVLGVGEENLLSIFDFVGGEYQRIWASWETAYQSLIDFPITGLSTFDFTADGKDELFVVGEATTVLRFSDWNITNDDFDSGEIIFTHSYSLTGYLTIGDSNNNGNNSLVF